MHKSTPKALWLAPLALAFSALLAGTSAAASLAARSDCALDAAQLEQIRQIDQDVVARRFAPGIVTSIFCDGQPLFSDAQGLADSERARPMTPATVFRIYSMSKPVTSVAALILADEGKLNIDDPVARFIPEFANAMVYGAGAPGDTVKPARPVSVRDLLRHTAGLTYRGADGPVPKLYVKHGIDNGSGAVVVPEGDIAPVASLEQLAQRIATIALVNQPGQRFTYGNATDVLGRVVEVASGVPLGVFFAERIFKPLGMNDTGFRVGAGQQGRLAAAYSASSALNGDPRILRAADTKALPRGAYALAEDPEKSIFSTNRSIAFGGAGLVSTAADYQRFLQMLLGGGAYDGKRIVSAQAVAQMTRNQLPESALATPQLAAQGLGFGLGVATIANPAKAVVPVPPGFYFWGGAASTYFWVDPARRLSGVIMTQVFGGDVSAFYIDMLRQIYPVAESATVDAARPTKN